VSDDSSSARVGAAAWTVVANPAAGRSRRRGAQRLEQLDAAVRKLQVDGIDIALERSSSLDDARARATTAALDGRDLVAAGGDGTVGAIAGVAADHQRRLAVVPMGSGNDFARVLGIDRKHPVSALDLLDDTRGRDRTIDLAQANGHWYNCVTCSGFDAEANRWANSVTKLRGTPLYIAAVLRTLAVYRPRPFAITVDDVRSEKIAWMVSVGNTTTYAGGMKIVPDAQLDDGLLDVCIVGDVSRSKFITSFPKVFSGRHGEARGVEFVRGAKVTVETLDGSEGELWADGERVDSLPATMVAIGAALTVRVPR
jgi:diacylglycerol kinase (ATP)